MSLPKNVDSKIFHDKSSYLLCFDFKLNVFIITPTFMLCEDRTWSPTKLGISPRLQEIKTYQNESLPKIIPVILQSISGVKGETERRRHVPHNPQGLSTNRGVETQRPVRRTPSTGRCACFGRTAVRSVAVHIRTCTVPCTTLASPFYHGS